MSLFVAGTAWLGGWCAPGAHAIETVHLNNESPSRLQGRVVVEAADGGVLLETVDSTLHLLEPQMLAGRSADEQPFVYEDREKLAARLLAELPAGFQVHHSKHYVVVYNTTRTYARWCSSLLERLHKGFLGYWKRLGSEVHEPEHPLVVLVFDERASYRRYAKAELGAAADSVIGYYSLTSNRVAMYDLTGGQSQRSGARGSLKEITATLSQPAAEPLVATIIHEATHQIAFNSGLQTRMADNPRWLSEGLALYFETPDLGHSRGWGRLGKVNPARWRQFLNDYQQGKTIALRELLINDKLLAEPQTAISAYAHAWAWNYYLIRHHPKEFVAYLSQLASQSPLIWQSEEERLATFRKHFGEDLDALTADFYRRMDRIR